MIRPQDLRIGNYVWNSTQFIPVLVDVKIIQEQINASKGFGIPWEPIKITEEILLKCGFYHKGSGFYCFDINDWSNVQIHFYKDISVTQLSVSKHSFVVKCENLHQLQNLFYCLCGFELDVNL